MFFKLFEDGSHILAIFIFAFSIALPMLKLLLLKKIINLRARMNGQTSRYLHLMHEYGRWAMVVAVLVVSVKLGVMASIEIHPGLYIFGRGGLLIMLLTRLHYPAELVPVAPLFLSEINIFFTKP